jgi:hypothetical protein
MLMRRIDELHMNYPFAGSRMLRDMLSQRRLEVGRRHVRTLMRWMAIETLYRKPNTSKPAPGHKIYPYLLRGLPVTRPTASPIEGTWRHVVLSVSVCPRGTLISCSPSSSRTLPLSSSAITRVESICPGTVHPQFPPKVEYELTEFGKTLCPAMKTLVDWAMTFPKTRETSRYQP